MPIDGVLGVISVVEMIIDMKIIGVISVVEMIIDMKIIKWDQKIFKTLINIIISFGIYLMFIPFYILLL